MEKDQWDILAENITSKTLTIEIYWLVLYL